MSATSLTPSTALSRAMLFSKAFNWSSSRNLTASKVTRGAITLRAGFLPMTSCSTAHWKKRLRVRRMTLMLAGFRPASVL